MNNQENLKNEEAIAKLKSLAEGIDVCMFCTDLDQKPITACPMSVNTVEEDGSIWFISDDSSNHNANIRKSNEVQLLFSHPTNYRFLSVYGTAKIHKDAATIEKYWSPIANAWFENGKEDPNCSIISIEPKDVYYWDTKDNKLTAFVKFAFTAITGTKTDGSGQEGNISI